MVQKGKEVVSRKYSSDVLSLNIENSSEKLHKLSCPTLLTLTV